MKSHNDFKMWKLVKGNSKNSYIIILKKKISLFVSSHLNRIQYIKTPVFRLHLGLVCVLADMCSFFFFWTIELYHLNNWSSLMSFLRANKSILSSNKYAIYPSLSPFSCVCFLKIKKKKKIKVIFYFLNKWNYIGATWRVHYNYLINSSLILYYPN